MIRIVPLLIIGLLSTTCLAEFSRLDMWGQEEAIELLKKDIDSGNPKKVVAEFLISSFNSDIASTNKLHALAVDQSLEYRYRATAIKIYFRECNFDTNLLEGMLLSEDATDVQLGMTLLGSLNPCEESYRLLCMVMDGGGPVAPPFRYPFPVAKACVSYLCTTGEYQRVVHERLIKEKEWNGKFVMSLYNLLNVVREKEGCLPDLANNIRSECILRETDYYRLAYMLTKEEPNLCNILQARRQKLERLLELIRKREKELKKE